MLAWMTKAMNPENTNINQYAKGTLTQAPINPVPSHSVLIDRAGGHVGSHRYAPVSAIDYKFPGAGNGIPLPPWLEQVLEAQNKTRELRFTPVPEYVKNDTNHEHYLKMGDALNKHHAGNADEVRRGIVNSQMLGLGNNRR